MKLKITDTAKSAVFKLTPWQIVLLSGIGAFALFYLAAQSVLGFMLAGPPAVYVLTGLSFLLLFTRMSTLSKFGVRPSYFFLFGLVLVFGPAVALLARIPLTLLHLKIATTETPLDFMLKKRVKVILRQTAYTSFFILLMAGVIWVLGRGFVLANLTQVFIGIYVLYSAILFGKRIILRQNIIHVRSLLVLVSGMLNFWLISTFGQRYITYLMGL